MNEMREIITSPKNPKVLLWRSLKDAKGRRETGCFLVEGAKAVEEALTSGFACEALLVQSGVDVPFPADVRVTEVSDRVMEAVCDTRTPQGVAAVMRIRHEAVTGCRLIALDGVQDPGNVGTILRTADAAGLDGALLSRACADPYSPKVLRATMGSIFHLPLTVTDDLPGELAARRDAGMDILSSQLDGSPFRAYAPNPQGYVLVIGSEGNGVTDAVRALATHRLRLPMRGRAESLNAAVAAGIMMYQLTEELG